MIEEILRLLIENQNQCCETCGHSCKDNKDWKAYWKEKLTDFEKKTKEDFLKRILPEEKNGKKWATESGKKWLEGYNSCLKKIKNNANKEGINL